MPYIETETRSYLKGLIIRDYKKRYNLLIIQSGYFFRKHYHLKGLKHYEYNYIHNLYNHNINLNEKNIIFREKYNKEYNNLKAKSIRSFLKRLNENPRIKTRTVYAYQ